MAGWIATVDKILAAKKPLTKVDAQTIEKRRDAIRQELQRLKTDEELIRKMMREGY